MSAALSQDPIPVRRVNVFVPREIAFDLKRMEAITQKVLGRLGCPACHSGHILNFQTLEDFIVNASGEVREFTGAAGF